MLGKHIYVFMSSYLLCNRLLISCLLVFNLIPQIFAWQSEFDSKKIDLDVIPVSNVPTILPTSLNYSLNSTVGTIRYDSSRNFTKWIFPTNRRKQFATKTYAMKVLSTQIYIESDDSAISINKGKKGKTVQPTAATTSVPTANSTTSPTQIRQPTYAPTTSRTAPPSVAPSKLVQTASLEPSKSPTKTANVPPTISPTTISPSKAPTAVPSILPPSISPSKATQSPSKLPSISPLNAASVTPTILPSKAVQTPTVVPSILPTQLVTAIPSISPSKAMESPSVSPSISPTKTSSVTPSKAVQTPTTVPSMSPSKATQSPSVLPSISPAKTSSVPPTTIAPSILPTQTVKTSTVPSKKGVSGVFSSAPTNSPLPSARPTSTAPTSVPSQTAAPSLRRSAMPSTAKPSAKPSLRPPSASPTSLPPSSVPSGNPLATPTTAPDSLKYNPGSKIMTGTVNLYNIYFGFFPAYPFLNSSQQTVNLVNYFSANIGDSSWYKTVTSYYHINSDGSKTYASASVVLKKSVLYQTAAKGRTVVDTDFPRLIVDLVNNQQLPVDENGIYNVFFRGDFKIKGWLQDANIGGWCAFHSSLATIDGAILKYTVQGDPSTAPAASQFYCEGSLVSPTVNGNTGADSMVNVLAHEIAETVTDYNDAWNEGSITTEIGDICGWKFMLGDNSTANWNVVVGKQRFLVQSLYRVGYGCVLSCC